MFLTSSVIQANVDIQHSITSRRKHSRKPKSQNQAMHDTMNFMKRENKSKGLPTEMLPEVLVQSNNKPSSFVVREVLRNKVTHIVLSIEI